MLRLTYSDLSTILSGGGKNFSAERFLLRSSLFSSRDHVAHLHCKWSLMVVACRLEKNSALWAQLLSSTKRWEILMILSRIKEASRECEHDSVVATMATT